MKISNPISEWLLEASGRLARLLGMSRSEPYSKVVKSYVEKNRALGVRERLDAVYEFEPESSQLDAEIKRNQSTSLATEK